VNSSLIATALVPIAAAMHVSVGRTAILVSALYLASSIAGATANQTALYTSQASPGTRRQRLDAYAQQQRNS
jgi:hypothetical protein